MHEAALKRGVRRLAPLAWVLLVHLLLLWLLKGAGMWRAVPAAHSEVTVRLLAASAPAGGADAAPPALPLVEAPRVTVPAPLPVLVVVETPAPVPVAAPAPASGAQSGAQGGGAGAQGGAAAGGEGGRIKTISSEVEYLRKPSPEYPAKARREHEEGDTLMLVLVSEAGAPLRASVEKSSGSARLDEAARVAVMGALFKPYMENGKALSVYALVPVKFRLSRG
ncbi:hypothetical protein RugamoR64_50020 [Duganella rhizosphaerae]|uniref:energy transducer TonB n=1 Tax=Duganella rhizosphaerae TaxID=2885763 RepID=UPI0030E7CBDB